MHPSIDRQYSTTGPLIAGVDHTQQNQAQMWALINLCITLKLTNEKKSIRQMALELKTELRVQPKPNWWPINNGTHSNCICESCTALAQCIKVLKAPNDEK